MLKNIIIYKLIYSLVLISLLSACSEDRNIGLDQIIQDLRYPDYQHFLLGDSLSGSHYKYLCKPEVTTQATLKRAQAAHQILSKAINDEQTQFAEALTQDIEESYADEEDSGFPFWKFIVRFARFGKQSAQAEKRIKQQFNCHLTDTIEVFFDIEESGIEPLRQQLQQGVDINFTDYDGSSLLMAAVSYNNIELTDFLLNNGADINIRDDTQSSAITSLDQTKQLNRKLLELLLKQGGNINDQAQWGSLFKTTLELHNADDNRLDDLRYLFDKGANPNLLDDDNTPEIAALCWLEETTDYQPLLALLSDNGAQLDVLLTVDFCSENASLQQALQHAAKPDSDKTIINQ